ncbi:hypothetical protein ABZV60_33120 [Streptomyces sp. NPDC004787]|uniref:hypothetical protein n=1 Tax=Streptomyces sp. NPDC004787 TaxID=3154291 RepID=UPI0033B272F9
MKCVSGTYHCAWAGAASRPVTTTSEAKCRPALSLAKAIVDGTDAIRRLHV